jgi:hypothetical protein
VTWGPECLAGVAGTRTFDGRDDREVVVEGLEEAIGVTVNGAPADARGVTGVAGAAGAAGVTGVAGVCEEDGPLDACGAGSGPGAGEALTGAAFCG